MDLSCCDRLLRVDVRQDDDAEDEVREHNKPHDGRDGDAANDGGRRLK